MSTPTQAVFCKFCKIMLDDTPVYETHCEPCHHRMQKWLNGSIDELAYRPRYDGAYFDDVTAIEETNPNKVLQGD